jgi:hypothetical protein
MGSSELQLTAKGVSVTSTKAHGILQVSLRWPLTTHRPLLTAIPAPGAALLIGDGRQKAQPIHSTNMHAAGNLYFCMQRQTN